MSNLQTRLRELRKENNLTQYNMAKLLREKYNLKTDRVMISKWETGFQTPEVYTITCIADLFGVTMDYLNGKEGTASHHNSIYKSLPESSINEQPSILKKYNKLNDTGKEKVEAYVDDLLAVPSYTIEFESIKSKKDGVKLAAGIPVSVPPKVKKKIRHT